MNYKHFRIINRINYITKKRLIDDDLSNTINIRTHLLSTQIFSSKDYATVVL